MPDLQPTAADRPRKRLRVGVQLPEVEYVARWPELLDMARAAEATGFDSLWVGDHHLFRREGGTVAPWEAWTLLAALASVTSRIELGPLVASTSFHPPGMIARFARTIDEVSGGRFVLGLGAGWNEVEHAAFGLPYEDRTARFGEALVVISRLLREGRLDFEGRFFRLRDCELLPPGGRQGGPPLMVGARGPRMLRLALPHVEAWNAWYAWYGNRPAGLRSLLAEVDAACRDTGRDPATLERTAAVLIGLPGGRGRRSGGGEILPPLTGDADELARGLLAYADLGIDHLQLVVDPITTASIEALGPVLERIAASG